MVAGQQAYFTFRHKWVLLTESVFIPAIEENVHNVTNVAVVSWVSEATPIINQVIMVYTNQE